ncbi:hypothetical protein GCM10010528_23020 [Gordonia defluvii]|uniref:Uncharacterized protein n=4 Tax=Gordonia TaxID=2053 RepID=M3VBI9_GORML|nr:hypothetical protein GSI01S_16_00110 [Gordonia sihwensis NBRC 108236]GAC80343.1 hypothetical protein GM1_017_00010 [Gordonia malaquae NBRC 108250]GEE02218.1 hypothetical protein nbrc107696_26640 [Gordonia spumicola]
MLREPPLANDGAVARPIERVEAVEVEWRASVVTQQGRILDGRCPQPSEIHYSADELIARPDQHESRRDRRSVPVLLEHADKTLGRQIVHKCNPLEVRIKRLAWIDCNSSGEH